MEPEWWLAIWRSAFLRASSRPVDMVFSIMGLFSFNLDPSKFSRYDRKGATIALIQAIMQKPGARADWIGISRALDPSPDVSIFPSFPEAYFQGLVTIRRRGNEEVDVSSIYRDEWDWGWYVENAATGILDDRGSFQFTAPGAKVPRLAFGGYEVDYRYLMHTGGPDGDLFGTTSDSDNAGKDCIYAAAVGTIQLLRLAYFGRRGLERTTLIIILRRTRGNHYYGVRMSEAKEEIVQNWTRYEFCVGSRVEVD